MANYIKRGEERLNVITAGTIVLPQHGHSLTVTEGEFTFTFQFVRRQGDPKVEADIEGSGKILLRVINFDNPVGTAFDAEVGTLNGEPLYLAIVVYAISGDTRITHPPRVFHYTLYVGPAL